jgi:Phospholipase_D-nuclease N-terminal
MVIAADYPFLDVLWTMIIFFVWVIWIWMMIVIITDIFRRRDIGGWSKAAWIVFLIIVPFLAALIYLIAQHDGMAERTAQQSAQAKTEFDSYVRDVAATEGPSGEIKRAKDLLDAGTITQEEFDQIKVKALA